MTESSCAAEEALTLLKEGNRRFITGVRSVDSFLVTAERVRSLAENGQRPFAAVLGCADSRVPAEVVFDRGLGDLFVPRIAGSVSTPFVIASIEYAALNLGTTLCVVLGHSQCGAVSAALEYRCTGEMLPSANLTQLIGQITPAVDTILAHHKHDAEGTLDRIIVENVFRTVDDLQRDSAILRGLVEQNKFMIVGAVYELHTGQVRFLDEAERRIAPTHNGVVRAMST